MPAVIAPAAPFCRHAAPVPETRIAKQTGPFAMPSFLRITVLLAALIGVAATATACNTVKGIGRDIEDGAEAVEDALQ